MTDDKQTEAGQKQIEHDPSKESSIRLQAKDKGKMIDVLPDITDIPDINPADPNQVIDVKVYRKWVSKNVPNPSPTGLRFILLDRKGNAIQANVEVRDMQQFETTLQLNSCYRIQGFGSKRTETWQRTLENNMTLLFGRYTRALPIEDEGFPEHYFNFMAYNELGRRANVRDSILTDYIGIIRAVGMIKEFGTATSNRILRKNVEVQNLNGNSVTLSFWNEMATAFEEHVLMQHTQPTILAVSSCIVKTFGGSIQLSATPATHYYFNPDVPESRYIREVYNDILGPIISTPASASTMQSQEQPSSQSVITIAELLQIDPTTISFSQRFTIHGTITTIEGIDGWYMNRCKTCNQRIEDLSPHWHCHPPGTPVVPNYSYYLKAIVTDATGSISLSCYSPEVDSFLPTITELLSYVPDRNPHALPPIIRDLQNTSRRFVLHFGKASKRASPRFVLDESTELEAPPLPNLEAPEPLPALPAPAPTSSAITASCADVKDTDETPMTEISLETITPPPPSTEAAEKKHPQPETRGTSVQKQLFLTSEETAVPPPPKKPKKNVSDPQE